MKNNFLKRGVVSLFTVAAFFGNGLLMQSCWDENEWELIPNAPFLQIEETILNFDSPEIEYLMTVKCNEEYVVGFGGGLENWCTATKDERGDLTLSIAENTEKDVRRGELYIKALSQADTIQIAQLGWGKAILVSSSTVNVDETGGDFDLAVTANTEYTFDYNGCDWVAEVSSAETRAHETVTKNHRFAVNPNKGETRSVMVKVSDVNPDSGIEGTSFTISQKGLGNYEPDAPEIGNDIKLTPNSVVGMDGDWRSDRVYDKMIDGVADLGGDTGWLSNWADPKFPKWFEFTFDEAQDIDYILYVPSYKGHFKNVKIEVYTDVNTQRKAGYTTVFDGQLVQNYDAATRIDFNEPQVGVTKVKFTLEDSYSDGECRCVEMEFYKKDPNTFDWKTLFANPACTELKSGLTEQDIIACNHSFYKNIAWYMYNNKYPREFRIADFKAYPHPDVQAKGNKTSTYSLLDNPTGISVNANENLLVMADLKGLESVNIRVQNLDTPGADGFGGTSYVLKDGVNTFNIKEKGLVYVMYHTADYETAPVITLHFASGKVNGYFDSQNPAHEGRWNELLNASVDKYFDVLGKYAHLTFPTLKFLNNTKDGKALIDWYDQLVYREQEFMGLEKYDKMFKNRMYFQVIYTSYMYSTSYRTCYNESTLDVLTNESVLNANCWGPAHEVGHSNQTRPGLKWIGTTEVTNNILAQYIQTTVCGESSRLDVKDNYTSSWNYIIVPGAPHATGADVAGGETPFCKVVPFWQLELYFGKVLGRTPMQQSDHGGFYPDVYEYVRTQPDQPTSGAQQLEFVYNCCLNGKANLLDFFSKWGFLTPIDAEISDYGTGRITITQNDIDNLKSRVEALGFSKPDVALEYITDPLVDSYKNKSAMVVGTAARNGNVITLNDWKHVAAFEVKDSVGNLVYIARGVAADGATREFTLPKAWQNGYTLEAVAVNGTRSKVSL